jgi:O-antigen/teichoic acid export membrane protein
MHHRRVDALYTDFRVGYMNDSSRVAADDEAIRRGIVSGVRWTYLSLIVQGIVKVAVIFILARLLGPREFGLLGYALMCTTFLERVAQLGVGPALVQRRDLDGDVLRTAQILGVGSGVLSMVAIYSGSELVASFFSEPELQAILRVLSLGCFIEALSIISDALLQRELRFREIMIAETIAYFVSMGVIAIGLAYLGLGVWALVLATLSLKVIRVWSARHARHLVRLSLGFSLGRLFNFFSLQGDNFVVGRILGVDALGMYTRAYQLMTLPAMYVGQIFERVMFPAMARNQDSSDRLRSQFLFSLEAIGLISLPAGVLMYLLGHEIIIVGFGDRWEPVVPVLSVLSFGVFFRTAYKCSDTVVRSRGAVYNYALRQGIYTLLVVSGAWCGAKLAGLHGVAIGVVGAIALNYCSMTLVSKEIARVSWRELLAAHLPGVNMAVWCGVAGYAMREWASSVAAPAVVTLLVSGVSGVLAGLLGTLIMWGLVPSRVARFAMTTMCGMQLRRATVPALPLAVPSGK